MLKEIYSLTNATKVTEEYPGEGKGVLEILNNPWDKTKAMLLVEGWDEWGVKAGSERIREAIKPDSKVTVSQFFLTKIEEEVTHPILLQVFPEVEFYKVMTAAKAPPTYRIDASYKGEIYHMPYDFNYLMLDYGIELNDLNAIDSAKAFTL